MASMQVLCASVLLMTLWTSVLGKNITMRGVKKTFSQHHKAKVVKHSAVAAVETIEEIEARNPTTSMYVPFGLPERVLLDQKSYVTVFDEHRNIPFYSAYLILAEQALQIGDHRREDADTDWKQGSLPDHANTVYEHNRNQWEKNELQRGHMDPVHINSFDLGYMSNTFVLSNAAPQYKTSNNGAWNHCEGWVAKFAKEECAEHKGDMHIFTGTSNIYVHGTPDPVVPTEMATPPPPKEVPPELQQLLKTKPKQGLTFSVEAPNYPTITIPRAMWTAACCVVKSNKEVIASMAVMTNNHWKEDQLHQTEMTVGQLQTKIKEGADAVVIFPAYPDCANVEKNVRLSEMYAEQTV